MIALDKNKIRISKDLPPVLQHLPKRSGKAPRIEVRYPCMQMEDTSPENLRDELLNRANRLPNITIQPTTLSFTAQALLMDEDFSEGQPEAFIRGKEFVIIRTDGSVHLPLMPEWGEEVLLAGWGCIHPLVRYMAGALPPQNLIIYAPRDEQELNIVWKIIQGAYFYARGWIENID